MKLEVKESSENLNSKQLLPTPAKCRQQVGVLKDQRLANDDVAEVPNKTRCVRFTQSDACLPLSPINRSLIR